VNTQVEVTWELKHVYMVQLEETIGFMNKDEVSTKKIKSGGGSKGSGGADGGDISLEYGGVTNLAMIRQEGQITGQAEVVVDGALVILGYFQRGDLAPVVAEEGCLQSFRSPQLLYGEKQVLHGPEIPPRVSHVEGLFKGTGGEASDPAVRGR
jgi:hypothetical protein